MVGQSGKALHRSTELKNMIRSGIPHEFREEIWKGWVNWWSFHLTCSNYQSINLHMDYLPLMVSTNSTKVLNDKDSNLKKTMIIQTHEDLKRNWNYHYQHPSGFSINVEGFLLIPGILYINIEWYLTCLMNLTYFVL